MNRIVLLVVAVLLAGTVIGCSSVNVRSYAAAHFKAEAVQKVAVAEVVGAVEGEPVKNQLSDFLAMQLVRRGFVVVERTQIKAVIAEQERVAEDATATERALTVGRLLNVDAVAIINIPRYGEKISLTAKLLDVKDGTVLWIGSASGRTGRIGRTLVGAVVGATIGALLGGDTSGSVAAGAGGAVLGGVAGEAMSPQESEEIQVLFRKLGKGIPKVKAPEGKPENNKKEKTGG